MGRVKSYDETEVLDKAMHCFWKHGYLNTSTRLLEKEMGINQFSIYASFQSKENLFRRILDKYTTEMNQGYLKTLKKEHADIRDVHSFFKAFAMDMADGKLPNSCLMVNSLMYTQVFSEDVRKKIDQFFAQMEKLFTRALTNSRKKKLLEGNMPLEEEAQYLLGIAQSISTLGKTKSKKALIRYIDNAIRKLR